MHFTPLSQSDGVFKRRYKGHPSSSTSYRLEKKQNFWSIQETACLALVLQWHVAVGMFHGERAQWVLPSVLPPSAMFFQKMHLTSAMICCSCFSSLFIVSFPLAIQIFLKHPGQNQPLTILTTSSLAFTTKHTEDFSSSSLPPRLPLTSQLILHQAPAHTHYWS